MKELFTYKNWRIVEDEAVLPDGRKKILARAERPDVVHVLPFVTKDSILVLEEYRPFFGGWIWMLVSGHVDKESDLEVAAHRELREETGRRAETMHYLFSANIAESVISTNHFFEAKNFSHDPLPQDDDELIKVHELGLNEALDKILTSKHVHMPSAYGLMRYMREGIFDRTRHHSPQPLIR